ncbi:Rho termination factor [Methylopila musalis]|uniref:Rho termination factor n=1 Tax=Methylopila musalis TaxID=1134781 RepID=A0ABW3Z4W4_9HYPH
MATKSQSHKATSRGKAAEANPSIKNPEVYEALREQGASKEKAARISNAQAKYGDKGPKSPSVRGGKSPAYEDWTRDALYERAREIGVAGLSRATKGELIHALRSH